MDLREAIIRTVCYFDLFDFPLSRAEICDRLYGSAAGAHEVDAAVATLLDSKILKEENDFISLSDRDGLSAVRAERKIFSVRKWKRARRWARIFAALPDVELVGVGNTLAYDNAKDGSDIDFFIVTAPGAVWRTRFFCAALAAVFDLRPKANDNRDKLCLSFFVTSEAQDMSRFSCHCEERTNERPLGMLETSRGNLAGDAPKVDIYMYYWIRQMTPLAGKPSAFELFRVANRGVSVREKIGSSVVLRLLFSPLALLPGSFMRNWQKRHFPQVLLEAEARHDGSVIISDSVLKFHVNDRRAYIYDRWQKRVKSILT
jgi:hypothetical protein